MTDLRPGERRADLPDRSDARLVFIGRIGTPWRSLDDCPRHGRLDGPLCRISVDPAWAEALAGITPGRTLQVLYWMDAARRDLVVQAPRSAEGTWGTFALRSPVRPNPIASSVVLVVGIEGTDLLVRGLDCLDGTPLLDLKPDRCPTPAGTPEPSEGPRFPAPPSLAKG